MKKVFNGFTSLILLLSAASGFARGQENGGVALTSKHQALYNALKVKAVKGNAGINGQMLSTKAVGGLVCTESILRIPQEALPFYSCSMSPDANSEEIYKALKGRAHEENPGFGGKSLKIKSVGSIECSESVSILPGAKEEYGCVFQPEDNYSPKPL